MDKVVYLHFRVDDKHFKDADAFFKRENRPVYITEEKASNLHWHILVSVLDIGKDPYKNYKDRFYRALTCREKDGSKEHERVHDADGMKRYLSKGYTHDYKKGDTECECKECTDGVKVIMNTMDVDVKKYHEMYWAQAKSIDATRKKKVDNQSKPRNKSMLELMLEYCEKICVSKSTVKTWNDAQDIVIRYHYVKFKVFPDDFMLTKYAKTLYIHLCAKWYDWSIDKIVSETRYLIKN